jgi:peptide deformylase
MPLRSILQYPDPRLREHSSPVADFDAELGRLVADLVDTLQATPSGIGISAPQVGDLRRVLIMDLSETRTEPEIYINPEILSRSTPGLVEESCLSIPGVVGNVVRSTELRVRALDAAGAPFERELSGMHAVCLQHEVDHLDGTLFIDRLPFLRRVGFRVRRALGAS